LFFINVKTCFSQFTSFWAFHSSLRFEGFARPRLPRGGLVLVEKLVLVALPHRVRLAADEALVLPVHAIF